MGNHILRQKSPDLLIIVAQSLPGSNCSAVQVKVLHLFSCTGKFGVWLRSEITDTIPVIEGDIAER